MLFMPACVIRTVRPPGRAFLLLDRYKAHLRNARMLHRGHDFGDLAVVDGLICVQVHRNLGIAGQLGF